MSELKGKLSLIVFTSDYPYGMSEIFLNDELKNMYSDFKQIIIVNEQERINISDTTFFIPPNARIVTVSIKPRLTDFFGILRYIKLVIDEFNFIRNDKLLRLSFYKIKVLFGALWAANIYKNRIESICEAFNVKDHIYYSYWLDEKALAMSILKSRHPEMVFFSRAHGWDLFFERNREDYLPFREFILNNISNLFTVSDYGRNYLINKFINSISDAESVIQTSRLGVDKIIEAPAKPNSRRTLMLLSIATIAPVKRLERIIHVLQKIDSLEIEWHHIGGGDGLDSLENLATSLLSNKSNIKFVFHGFVFKESFINQMTKYDLIINTSDNEGIPVSIMEAFSCGIPAIGTRIGGVPELIEDEKNGYLVNLDNNIIHSLVERINRFAALTDQELFGMKTAAYNTWKDKYWSVLNFEKHYLSISKSFNYKECSQCVLSNFDYSEISFDDKGVCEFCRIYEKNKSKILEVEDGYIDNQIEKIKLEGENKDYDCIVGISGGIDSTYLAYWAKQMKLRPLLVHVDGGWNTELAVSNIEKTVKKLGLDLYTVVVNWEQIRDLQISFVKADVLDIDLVFDNVAWAHIYKLADKMNIKYIVTGHNINTESILPPNFTHFKYDSLNLWHIHKLFGEKKLSDYPFLGPIDLLYYTRIKKIKFFSPLNYLPFNKLEAKAIMEKELDWKDYGNKHYENIFTRFYQGYILVEKFNVDKRKGHLSSMICSGTITKEAAIMELKIKPYSDAVQLKADKEFFAKKLGMTNEEFDLYIQRVPKPHATYYSWTTIINSILKLKRALTFR